MWKLVHDLNVNFKQLLIIQANLMILQPCQGPTVETDFLYNIGPPGILGIWGEGLFIFRELGSTANYFRGATEQAHTFGDLGSTAKKLKK